MNDAAGQSALQQFDTNGDGVIAGSELEKAPGLKAALPRVDADKDNRITAEEIDKRIDEWRKSRVGLASCVVTIRQHGQPVVGANVTMMPEKFLGDAVEAARGVTSERGVALMQISDEPDKNGVRVGFYRVEVSKTINGKETIPTRYNTQTELGLEVAADVFDSRNPFFDLQSR
jgi:hypothetical protein